MFTKSVTDRLEYAYGMGNQGWSAVMVDDSNDPLDRLERGVQHLANRQRWEQANRLSLLWVHSGVGVLAGFFMMVNGTATAFEVWLGQDTARILIGTVGAFGGVMLALGLIQRPRNIASESIGLSILLLWDLALTVGFLINVFNSPDGAPPPKAYPVVIYGGYFLLLMIHILTLFFFRKGRPKP